jgi:tetratricopeptide (TPR) repeat protein
MVDNEELFSEGSGEDTMLNEAVNALRLGDRARARDLLTRLLKADQKKSIYWVWLSAAVDTQKERLYCLQRALEADPENSAAKRGLVLLGALPADPSVPPFPVNRPRLWEEKLKVPQEGIEIKRGWANPMVRFFIVLGIAVMILGGLFLTGTLQFPATNAQDSTSTHHPTFTLSPTPTVTPVFRTPTPTFLGATPLAFFLAQTYTPTPLYVVTQHPVLTRASYDAGVRSMAAGNFETARIQFQDVLKSEPDAADVYYYIGESYRLQGNYSSARDAYQLSIEKDTTFAPAFLGRARANLGLDPNADVIADLKAAVKLDPKFAEAYIDRGAYLVESDPAAAKKDLVNALKFSPDSAPAYLYLANAELSLGENEAALAAATHANELDMTLVPVYLALARAYIATGQIDRVVGVLHTYTIYMPGDTSAFVQLGTAYNAAGDYEAAVEVLDQAIDADGNNAEAYYQRGKAYLELDNPDQAESDLRKALNMDPLDFDAQLGLARAFFLQGKPGNAWAQVEKQALPLAKTDETKAQAYYWEAIFVEEIGDPTSVAAARNYWNKMMALPADAMPAAWRAEASQHLKVTPTSVPTQSPTRTPARTTTPSPTRTPAKTLSPTSTRAFTITQTPTP